MHGQNVHVGHYTKLACNMHCNMCMYIMQVHAYACAHSHETCMCRHVLCKQHAHFMQVPGIITKMLLTCPGHAWHYVFQGHHQWKPIINETQTTLALTEKRWLPGTEKGTHFLQWTTFCLVKKFVRIPCESELQVTWEPSAPQIMYPVWVGKGFSGEKKVQVPRESIPVQVTWTVG